MHEHDVNDEGVSARLPGDSGDQATAESPTEKVQAEQTPVLETRKRGGSAWKFAGGVLLGMVVFAGVMASIGAHLENPDLSPDTPSELELTRQNLAEQAARIDSSAEQLLGAKEDATLQLVALSATDYGEMLGGVWVPWPSGAPSGYTNPPVATAAPADVTSAVLVEELTSFSQSLLKAVDSAPEENRTELLSAALGSQFLAMNLGGSKAPTCGDVDIPAAGAALAGVASSHASASATTPSSSADSSVLRTTDNSRQWLETDAAALPDGSRDAQVARTETFAALEESILRAGAPDTREAYAAYPVLQDGETYTSQALRVTTAEILKTAATATASDRENLMALACSLPLTAAERAIDLPFPGSE